MDSDISYNQIEYMAIRIWVNLLVVVIIMPQVYLFFIVTYAPDQILLKRDLMM